MNNMKSTTPIIDHKIMTINEVICRHLASFDNSTRGMMSQDILAQLRTFVEHICLKIYANGIEIENSYENICNSLRHIEAQGLEYESVKIVITEEVDELISHNIFYTAITRARKKLKIYWTPEVEKKVLSSISPRNTRKEAALLKKYI